MQHIYLSVVSMPVCAQYCLLSLGKSMKITLLPADHGYTCVYVCAWSKIPHAHIYALQYAIECIHLSIVSTPVCA